MRTLEVVAAVIAVGDTVLACRRAPDRSSGGKWEFPGGKVEPGESPADALVREIREELDVDIRVGELLDRSTTVMGDVAIDLACYSATLVGPAPTTSTDHDELRWLAPGELPALDWANPDLPLVKRLTSGRPYRGTAPSEHPQDA